MKKLKLYIAMSLNGKIARSNGDVDWLEAVPNPDESDYGFSDFFASIDTTIQGNKSYEKVVSWNIPFPYSGKKNYVFTTNSMHEDNKDVSYVSKNHIDFVKILKQEEGKDIWLIGGGQINTMLLKEALIDELQIFIMPIVIPDGISLFGKLPFDQQFELTDTKVYSSGVVAHTYTIRP